jgi:hypothetical protein
VNKCIDCKKIISKKAKHCKSCAKKGKLNPAYKHGKCLKQQKCMDCGKLLGKHSGFYHNLRCFKCNNKIHSKRMIGKNNPMFGIKRYGKKSPHWQGGKTIINYNRKYFNDILKEQIRKRDNYICQLCHKKREIQNRKLSIHHIDYNKNNCKKNNLITLCLLCNLKVNFDRDYWYAYFTYLIKRE